MIARFFALALALVLVCMPAVPVLADASTDTASDAGVINKRIKDQAEQPSNEPPPEPTIEREPERPVQPELPEVTVVLEDIRLDGNTVLPTQHFQPLIAAYLHHALTLRQLQGLALAIQQEYRRLGYLTTVAYIPPQHIADGRVTILVLEGRMGNLIIQGNRFFRASRFRWYWTIKTGELLRYQDIRRALARMNKHPDHRAQSFLRAGSAPGTTDVILNVTDHLPMHTGLQWDRQGTASIGHSRYGASLSHNNLLGLDDRLLVGSVFGRRFGAAYANYVLPLHPSGTTLQAGFSHSQTAPGRQYKSLGVNGASESYSATLSQPLYEGDAVAVEAKLGGEFKESRTLQVSSVSRRERLRVIRFGPQLQLLRLWRGWTSIENEYSFGLNAFGASSVNNPLAGRPGAAPNFCKVLLKMTRVQFLPWNTRAVLSIESQLTPEKLASSEQLYMGGANSVRGYPEGDYLADMGIVARVDYLIPWRFLPARWHLPACAEPLRDELQFIAFADRGYGRMRGITGEERSSRNLMGIGFGVAWQIQQHLSVRLEWGVQVGQPALTDDSPSALHVTLRYDL